MIDVIGEAKVSAYLDAAALLLMIILQILMAGRMRGKKTTDSLRIFRLLLQTVALNCLVNLVFNLMYGQPAPWCHTAAMILQSLFVYINLVITTLWLAFVDRKLNGRKKLPLPIRLLRISPVVVCLVLLIVNFFIPVVFTISPENTLEQKTLYNWVAAVMYVMFLLSALFVWRFDRRTNKIRFFRIGPLLITVFLGIVSQFFMPYKTLLLALSIGCAFLTFSLDNETRFVDSESGLYTLAYLSYLFDLALAGKNDFRSVLILEADGDLPAATKILFDVLHQNGDVIRAEGNRFLMFSEEDSRSTLQYQSSLVEEAAERHNAEHPDQRVSISARCQLRTAQEDAFSFLRSVLEQKEAGDEMRGIVSMISELDRLDKELKLAADIQINMLPMIFPPFPDRTEFDLYASMTPAKEVGGDFYDFFLIDSGHLALVIADVSGKGIPAALFMMVSRTLIKNQLMSGCTPAEALDRVNQQLCERNSSMMFVTVWLAVLEIATGKGLACNAGHEKPAVRRAGGAFGLLEYRHDVFIGVSRKAKYHDREFTLGPGDCVFVYTDGVAEATDADEKMFGEERLADTLNQGPDAGPEELIRRMHGAVDRFANVAPQFDDITMLCLKYNGTNESKQPKEEANHDPKPDR